MALFTVAKKQKSPTQISTNNGKIKCCIYINKMDYYSAIKMTNFKKMLNERKQEKFIHCITIDI